VELLSGSEKKNDLITILMGYFIKDGRGNGAIHMREELLM